MGAIIKGAGERSKRFRDRLFEDVTNQTSGGRGKEEDHGSGAQVEFSPSLSGLLSVFCGG